MRRRARGITRFVLSAAVALAAHGSASGTAEAAPTAEVAAPLTSEEIQRLTRGLTVIREQTFEQASRRYVGGITYTMVEAAPAEIAALLEDVDAYRRLLPRTKRARLVAAKSGDRWIEIVQGNSVVQAEYTIRVRRAAAVHATREYRFWLDPTRPHGIDDAWGFFRLEPATGSGGEPRVLLTYGVLVDIGDGIVRNLFEERVRAALLSVPDLVRRCVADLRRNAS